MARCHQTADEQRKKNAPPFAFCHNSFCFNTFLCALVKKAPWRFTTFVKLFLAEKRKRESFSTSGPNTEISASRWQPEASLCCDSELGQPTKHPSHGDTSSSSSTDRWLWIGSFGLRAADPGSSGPGRVKGERREDGQLWLPAALSKTTVDGPRGPQLGPGRPCSMAPFDRALPGGSSAQK